MLLAYILDSGYQLKQTCTTTNAPQANTSMCNDILQSEQLTAYSTQKTSCLP